MTRSVNKVIVLGHLGKDAETNFTPSGVAVTKFSVATSRRWKDGQSNEWKEEADWHNIVLWKSENLANYLTKVSRCSLIVEFSFFVFNKVHDFNAEILHLNRGLLYLNRELFPKVSPRFKCRDREQRRQHLRTSGESRLNESRDSRACGAVAANQLNR